MFFVDFIVLNQMVKGFLRVDYVDNTGDQVIENNNEGIDTVQSSITYTLGDNTENLILILLDFSKPEKGRVDGEDNKEHYLLKVA